MHSPRIGEPTGLNSDDVVHVFGVSRRVAYLYGSGLWMTVDGGERWRRSRLPRVRQVLRVGSRVFVLSDGSRGALTPILWRSRVGSVRWRALNAPVREGAVLTSFRTTVVALDAGQVTSGHGAVGSLWDSGDGGTTWRRYPVPCRLSDGAATMLAIARGDPDLWYLDCFDGQQAQQAIEGVKHHLFRSQDGGRSWRRVVDPAHTGVPTGLVANAAGNVVLAVTNGGLELLRRSADSGRTWRTALSLTGGFNGPVDLHLRGGIATVVCTRGARGTLFRARSPFEQWRAIGIRLRPGR